MDKELIAKVNRAEALSDVELEVALYFYEDLYWKLDLLGERFIHAASPVHSTLTTLRGYKAAREEHKEYNYR